MPAFGLPNGRFTGALGRQTPGHSIDEAFHLLFIRNSFRAEKLIL